MIPRQCITPRQLFLERFDFSPKIAVLLTLDLKELLGQPHFLGKALGRQEVDILRLSLSIRKILSLHEALVDEGPEHIEGCSVLDPHGLGDLSR
jgi:hypothetical protein